MDKKNLFAPVRPKKNPFQVLQGSRPSRVRRSRATPQLHKEAEEAKKKRLDEEAAQVYEEFVTSFDGGSAQSGPKAFVRGGIVEPGSRPSSEPKPPSERLGTKYVPSFIPPALAASKTREEKPASVFDLPARGDKGKPRAIDAVLAELQREQQERRERGGSGFDVLPDAGAHRGSHDTGDPCTTNLYVGNLAPTLDEHTLRLAFGKYGPIASIKIMWPRDDEQRTGGRMSGFVAYVSRRSAEEALESMQGMVLHNSELRLGWSKAVQLPAVPCWPPPSGFECGFSMVGAPTLAHDMSRHAALPPRIDVRLPRTSARLHLIDTLASYVLNDGTPFENMLCARERGNPDFAFLSDQTSEEYLYYKWRVYSLAQGDSLAHWREQEFQLVQGGSVWVPPKMEDLRHVVASGPGADVSTVVPVAVGLTEEERDAFEDILRSLTVERSSIRTAMLFALDHAAAAAEISDTLVQALTLRETPVAVKVARLFLLSDVLHNSNAAHSNAAAYRLHLISRLPLVFESLHEAYSTLDSRITAQELRRRVTAVLRAWADWFMFGQHFLGGLEATFVGLCSSAASRLADDSALRATLQALSDEDLERRCSDNGLSTLAGRDSCIERLLALDCFRRAQSGELPCAEEQDEEGAQPAEPAERGTWTVVSEPPVSRWTSVDAVPEREPDSRKRSRSPSGPAVAVEGL